MLEIGKFYLCSEHAIFVIYIEESNWMRYNLHIHDSILLMKTQKESWESQLFYGVQIIVVVIMLMN